MQPVSWGHFRNPCVVQACVSWSFHGSAGGSGIMLGKLTGRRLCCGITGRGQGRKVFDGLLTTSHNISHIRHSWQQPCSRSDRNHLTILPSCLLLYCVSLSLDVRLKRRLPCPQRAHKNVWHQFSSLSFLNFQRDKLWRESFWRVWGTW